jgi:hypothetical protein
MIIKIRTRNLERERAHLRLGDLRTWTAVTVNNGRHCVKNYLIRILEHLGALATNKSEE